MDHNNKTDKNKQINLGIWSFIGQPNIDNIIQILIQSEKACFCVFCVNRNHIKPLFDYPKRVLMLHVPEYQLHQE